MSEQIRRAPSINQIIEGQPEISAVAAREYQSGLMAQQMRQTEQVMDLNPGDLHDMGPARINLSLAGLGVEIVDFKE